MRALRTTLCAIALLGALPAAAATAAEVAGVWNVMGQIQAGDQVAIARPVCTLQQQGAALSGVCEGPNSAGPISGTVEGAHVVWKWNHAPKADIGLKGVSTFNGQLGADGAITGAWTYDGLPGDKGSFRAERK